MAKTKTAKPKTQIKLTPAQLELRDKQEFLADFIESYMEKPEIFLKGNGEALAALDNLTFKRVDITFTIDNDKKLSTKFTTVIDGKKFIVEKVYKPAAK